MAPPNVPQIAETLARAPKYRHLCPETLRRVAAWAAPRSRTAAEAVKRAKRKLHQVYGAYLRPLDAGSVEPLLDKIAQARADGDDDAFRHNCRKVLALHASTRERLPHIEGFYQAVFQATGTPTRLLDIGCGLAPFALPWMHLPPQTHYLAWEIDRRVTAWVSRLFALTGRGGSAQARDVLVTLPDQPADVTLLLKMLPSLRRQQPDCWDRILRGVPGRFVVASFPAASLAGREKNMPRNYAAAMATLLDETGWHARRLDFQRELVFVIDRENQTP